MKAVTPYLLQFALTAALLTIVFRYALSYVLENELHDAVMLSSAMYGAFMFTAGWIYGKKDSEYLPIFDLGVRFHLATFLVHHVISMSWVGLGFGSKHESIATLSMIAGYWSIFLVIHFIVYLTARKRTITSLDREDIFE